MVLFLDNGREKNQTWGASHQRILIADTDSELGDEAGDVEEYFEEDDDDDDDEEEEEQQQ
jgi:hypothetical protein